MYSPCKRTNSTILSGSCTSVYFANLTSSTTRFDLVSKSERNLAENGKFTQIRLLTFSTRLVKTCRQRRVWSNPFCTQGIMLPGETSPQGTSRGRNDRMEFCEPSRLGRPRRGRLSTRWPVSFPPGLKSSIGEGPSQTN